MENNENKISDQIDAGFHAQNEHDKIRDRHIEIEPVTMKCRHCDGDGYTAEHNPDDPHHDGDCNGGCPVQVPCEDCHGEGHYITMDWFRKYITALTEKHNTELERLKRFDGSDDHPEHRCQRCTGRNLSCWFADNDEWNKVVGDDFGILCPNCFNELSALKGIQPTAWRLSREGDAPLADKLKERIYNLTEKHRAEMEGLKETIEQLRVSFKNRTESLIGELRSWSKHDSPPHYISGLITEMEEDVFALTNQPASGKGGTDE